MKMSCKQLATSTCLVLTGEVRPGNVNVGVLGKEMVFKAIGLDVVFERLWVERTQDQGLGI